MYISNSNQTYNSEINNPTPKATDNIINSNTTEVPLSYRQLLTRSVRQLAYRYQTSNNNEVMSAEEFKFKLRNNQKFCPNTVYVIYPGISEDKSSTIPRIVFNAVYNYIADPNYMETLDLSDAEVNNLPKRLHVKGSVNLSKTNIYKLPEEFIVDHDLNISECHNLTKLPEKLSVKNSIDAHKSGIKYLNTNFNAGSLDVSECIDLEEIPEKPLNVCSDINFSNCSKIKHMPSWIISTTKIPLDEYSVSNDPKIKHTPGWVMSITRIPSNYRQRRVYLNGTAISCDSVINKMKELQKENINNDYHVIIYCNNKSNDGILKVFSTGGSTIGLDISENNTKPGSGTFNFGGAIN